MDVRFYGSRKRGYFVVSFAIQVDKLIILCDRVKHSFKCVVDGVRSGPNISYFKCEVRDGWDDRSRVAPK